MWGFNPRRKTRYSSSRQYSIDAIIKIMKIINTFLLLFISLICFSQENICIEDSCIYAGLQARRHSDSLYQVAKLVELKTTHFDEPHNDKVNYSIGRTYYEDFLLPYKKTQPSMARFIYQPKRTIYDSILVVLKEKYFKRSFFENSADSALYYFKKIKNIDLYSEKSVFFAINQLECFVDKDSSIVDLGRMVSPKDYIPFWYLANLSEDWKYDKSKDYLDLIYTSLIITPNVQSSLSYMNEPSLYQMVVPKNSEIFRLTFEPSFHDDICIRVEKNDDKVILYWKISRKKYGSRVGIKKQGKKEIPLTTWQYYMQLLDDFDFMNLTNRTDNVISGDGASWFLEYKTNAIYKALYRKIPNRNIEILCQYLLELSGVNYKTDKWEPGYIKYDLILTKDDKYIITKDLEDTIIACLNQNIDQGIERNSCCCYFDSYLKFNKKGRIKIVRFPAEDNWLLDKWSGFQVRKCRKEMKKALKKLDLSYLNLQKPIYYYLEVCYDKEKHMFKKKTDNCQ
jgi:hypothetical protein